MLKTAQKTVKFLIVVFNCLGWLSWRLYNLWTSNTLCCTGESFCLLALDTTHCCCSVTQLYLTLFDPCTAACQASLSFTISQSFLNSCPLSRWCHPTILSSVIPFSSCPQSFPASGSFLRSWLFVSGGQSIGVSASASVLLMNIQDWFPLGLVWSPCCPRDSQESSPTPQLESINSPALNLFIVQLSHPYMITRETVALTRWTFVGKVMSLLFHMLSRFVMAFLPRSKHLLIAWLQSPSAVILEPKKIKSVTISTLSLSICHKVMGLDAMILVFWMFGF